MTRKRIISMVILALAVIATLSLLGCSLCNILSKGKEVATTVVETKKTIEAEATKILETVAPELTAAAATPTKAPAAKATPTPGAEATTAPTEGAPLTEAKEAFEKMHSYRYEIHMSYDVPDAETEQEASMTFLGAEIREPRAYHYIFTDEREGSKMEMIFVNDVLFMYDEEQGGWIAMPGGEGSAFGESLFTPADFLEDEEWIEDAKLVNAHEKVDGVDCSHYQIRQENFQETFGDEEVTIKEGEMNVWVANDQNYVAKVVLKAVGVDQAGHEGNMDLTLRVYDVNKDFEISPPPEEDIIQDMTGLFGGGDELLDSLPIPDDAADVVVFMGMKTFASQLTIDELVQFYRDEMPPLGWTEDESQFATMEGMATMTFIKDGDTVNIVISDDAENNRRQVMMASGE